MRIILLSAAAIATVCAATAHAGAPRSARSVQLISMGGPASPQPAVTADDQRDEAQLPAAPQGIDGFRVHDLSRRWVEFEMASNFTGTSPGPDATADEDPFAHVGVARPSAMPVAGVVAPASAIPVPLWMRGGPIYAAAAYRYVPGCAGPTYSPAGFLSSDAEMRRAGYYGMMSNIACEYGIPVGLFDAMIIRESRYQPDAFSPKSAFGLTQLMPGTAAALGVNRYSVEDNLRGGAKYLRQQLDRFGHYHLALAAYNAGPGRVRNGLVPRIAETQDYVDNVLLNWSRLSGLRREATIISALPRSSPSDPAGTRPLVRAASVSTF